MSTGPFTNRRRRSKQTTLHKNYKKIEITTKEKYKLESFIKDGLT